MQRLFTKEITEYLVDLTKYFVSESKFFIFPQCDFLTVNFDHWIAKVGNTDFVMKVTFGVHNHEPT